MIARKVGELPLPRRIGLATGGKLVAGLVDGIYLVDLETGQCDPVFRPATPDPRARFHWADATRGKWGPVDAVVMNPPFHTGRAADPALGVAFIRAAAAMLTPSGTLWMVANRHLPYEPVLAAAFREVEEIGGDSRFRLTRAARPLRA